MTTQEAIKNLKSFLQIYDLFDVDRRSIQMAIDKMDKYRWHDLRKNPDDLPPDGQEVLLLLDSLSETVESYWLGWYVEKDNVFATDECDFERDEIKAWKYIEPFEVEE